MARISAMILTLAVPTMTIAADPAAWPQFRGPNGSGVAAGQKPPVQFGPEKNVKWKAAVPPGASCPVVAGDKLFVTAFADGKLLTLAYDRGTGKELWRAEAPAAKIEAYHKTEGSPAASTCATDGERVVSYFGSCGLFCYGLDGKEQWRYEMPTARIMGDFGTGTSPVIADGLVILVRDVENEPRILALDAKTGSKVWDRPRESKLAYSTPLVWDTGSGKELVAAGFGKMVGYDLKTGEPKWTVSGMPAAQCTTPVVGDGMILFAGWSPGDPSDKEFKFPTFDELLKQGDADGDGAISKEESEKTFLKGFFDNNDLNKDGKITREEFETVIKIMSSSKNSAFAVKTGGKGDVTATHVAWRQTKGVPYVASPVCHDGVFYMVKDGGLMSAYDAKTGKPVYQLERAAAPGQYYASPVIANGHIYLIAVNGDVTVVKTGDSPDVAFRGKLGERVSATPAIADDTLYVRTAGHLYAFAERK